MEVVMIALIATLAVVAVLAGVGFGLAFGWRNGRDIALGRYGPPRPPSEPTSAQNPNRSIGMVKP